MKFTIHKNLQLMKFTIDEIYNWWNLQLMKFTIDDKSYKNITVFIFIDMLVQIPL